MARRRSLAYIPRVPIVPHEIVKGVGVMSSKALQMLAFLALVALTFYVAFGGGM